LFDVHRVALQTRPDTGARLKTQKTEGITVTIAADQIQTIDRQLSLPALMVQCSLNLNSLSAILLA
jgi:hypothetical protein